MPEALRRTSAIPSAPSTTRFMLFGGGNFIRAFAGSMIDLLNKKTSFEGGMMIVKPTQGRDYSALRQQDGLYHVVLNGQQDGQLIDEAQLVTTVTDIVHVYDQWKEFLASAQNKALRYIISNTTESGITFLETDQANDAPPSSFPAKLCLWLLQRFEHFGADPATGVVCLPCELSADNGTSLKTCILQYADLWDLDPSFKDWIHSSCTFCNTLVDRIVTGYPAKDEAKYHDKVGFVDHLMAVGEPYHSWVIEGPSTLAQDLPFQEIGLNVKWVDDLTKYREQKVKILNGAHTSMVPTGHLAGMLSVKETIDHPELGAFIAELLEGEVWPTLAFDRADLADFTTKTMDRFRNPFLFHKLLDIALNSISKFKARLLPSFLEYYELNGHCPPRITFAFSSLLLMYRGQWAGEVIPLRDAPDVLAFCQTLWEESEDHLELVQKFLAKEDFWGRDLSEIQGLVDLMVKYVQAIQQEGVLASLTHIKSFANT
ncbi:MAG: tagaturonate reductase [Saprospiraceae bacterium]|nr:tagaturonate reductase [Saprospiraceae bacterium]